MALDDPGSIVVTVAFSPAAGEVDQVRLALPAGSTVAQALAASGMTQRHPQAAQLPVGVWGRKAEPEAPLRDQDRVEIYRPLQCDPKEARRLRYRQKAQKQADKGAAQAKTAPGPAPPPALSGNRKP